MPNPDRLLWPNAFVKARMLVETRKDAIVVPLVAIQHGPQGTYVYAVGQDKTAQMKPVTVALTTGDVAVIGKGLEGGEQVIVEGQNQVRPGGRVEPSSPGGGAQGPGGPSAGQPEHRRGRHGPPDADQAPGGASQAAESGSSPDGGRAGNGQDSSRPGAGQSRSRGTAAGPTASTQGPAAP